MKSVRSPVAGKAATYQRSRWDGRVCETAVEKERSLWMHVILHRSKQLSHLQEGPASNGPQDVRQYGKETDKVTIPELRANIEKCLVLVRLRPCYMLLRSTAEMH